MKRLFMICFAVSLMLSAKSQTQVKVTKNDESVQTFSGFYSISIDDSTKSVSLSANTGATLSMDELKSISFQRDNLPWNLQWRYYASGANPYMFGYGAIMHIRDVMTEDLTRPDTGYNWFNSWAENVYQGKSYIYSRYIWGYLRDMVIDANEWIAACQNDESQKGLLGAAYASRALLYLDMARMYEFLPNDRTSALSASGQDLTGLTVPIITESTFFDVQTGSYSVPRATRQEMAAFIQDDLDKAEALLPLLDNSSNLLPRLDVVYGLKARLYMWTGDYVNARSYAAKAIEASATKPMTRNEMLSTTNGFNDVSKWMWGVRYLPEDAAVMSGLCNWTSWMSNENEYGYSYYVPLYIGKSLYDSIRDTDVRKLLWVAPYGSALDGQAPLLDADMFPLSAYASVKFRPNEGSLDDRVADCSAFPLMRIEEMYLIQAEAAAQQGDIAAARQLLNQFMQENRDPSYNCTLESQQDLVNEIILQKRIELWGEGQTYFDVKRLNLPVARDYEGSNFPSSSRFNTQGRPAWMNFIFPKTEEERNISLAEMNNPDPSNVYSDDYKPLEEDSVRKEIQGDITLKTPKFIDKIDVLPLDSVYQLLFAYQLPKHGDNVSFESKLQLSLSKDFPNELTKNLNTLTNVDSLQEISIYSWTMSNDISYLLEQQGKPRSGEIEVFLRTKAYVQELPAVQLTSNIISFRIKVSEEHIYRYGYSYAPKLSCSSVGTLDMERLAGLGGFQACNLKLEGEGTIYNTSATDWPLRLNLNLWNMGFNIDEHGFAGDPYDLEYDQMVQLYKLNWGERYTGHPAEYPGQQDYRASVSCRVLRDDLVFYLNSTFPLSVIINRQAWDEYDYSWQDQSQTVMKSELMPDVTTLTMETDTAAHAYRLLAPYAKGHNLMLFVQDDGTVTMPRQYAYNNASGEPVYASATGSTDNGYVFDMQVRFFNADSTQVVTCHEVYGEVPEWVPAYHGYFESYMFDDSYSCIVYKNTSNTKLYLMKPFIYNDEGLVFTVDDDGYISFETTSTGFVYSGNYMIMAEQSDNGENRSHVDTSNGTMSFHFFINYKVDIGSFGVCEDKFIVTK